MKKPLLQRFQKWFLFSLAFGIVLYLVGSVWAGLHDVQEELKSYQWWAFGAAILLTLLNYVLRFIKWHYLCTRLEINISFRENFWIFFSGLSMAISPAKQESSSSHMRSK